MISENSIIEQISKTAVIGTAIVFFTNIFCFAIGFVIAGNYEQTKTAWILTVVLCLVAVIDISVGFILKRRLLKPLFTPGDLPADNFLSQTMMKTAIVISVLCAAPPIYGLVVILLGAKLEIMAGFSIISLGGFMLLRLRPRDFQRLHKTY